MTGILYCFPLERTSMQHVYFWPKPQQANKDVCQRHGFIVPALANSAMQCNVECTGGTYSRQAVGMGIHAITTVPLRHKTPLDRKENETRINWMSLFYIPTPLRNTDELPGKSFADRKISWQDVFLWLQANVFQKGNLLQLRPGTILNSLNAHTSPWCRKCHLIWNGTGSGPNLFRMMLLVVIHSQLDLLPSLSSGLRLMTHSSQCPLLLCLTCWQSPLATGQACN